MRWLSEYIHHTNVQSKRPALQLALVNGQPWASGRKRSVEVSATTLKKREEEVRSEKKREEEERRRSEKKKKREEEERRREKREEEEREESHRHGRMGRV